MDSPAIYCKKAIVAITRSPPYVCRVMQTMNEDIPIVVYADDGPAFSRACPKCGRFMKFPETIRYRTRFDDSCEFPDIDCTKCGPVQPDHIGWGSDFR